MRETVRDPLTQTTPGPTLPPEQPLAMPRQAVHQPGHALRAKCANWQTRTCTLMDRGLLLTLTVSLSWYGIREMYGVISTGSVTQLQWAFLLLFGINFSWVAFALAQAVLGFLASLLPSPPAPSEHKGPLPFSTAVLLPVFREDPRQVAAAIAVMRNELLQQSDARFAIFILSDTDTAADWARESLVYAQLTREANTDCPVYYRRRNDNSERKAGNIADWVARWGGAYEAMIVLDADSLICGRTLVRLVRRLAAEPGLGLIQTLPTIVRARSLFGRLQQFAGHCYGPVYARGLASWHGLSSNFWGHNAIIRTRAFAECCKLPVLRGRAPFGGAVLSHDFIEAALLRRAGWGVRFDADLEHSHEEAPPSLSDVLVRDRRWCQGNLQHCRFLLARGLAWPTRLHLLAGIMSYLSAVFWLLLILLGLAMALQTHLVRPEYFSQPGLFPAWPIFDAERAVALFVWSMIVVLAPKLMGWLVALLHPAQWRGFGGPLLLTLSVLLETLLSALYAPILMLAQCTAIFSVLIGRDSGWRPQSRADGALSWRHAARLHWAQTLFGLAIALLAWQLSPALFLWLSPLALGLLLAIPLSWLSGGERRGAWLDWAGLLRAPEERNPCATLKALELRLGDDRLPAGNAAIVELFRDEPACSWHLGQLDWQDPGGAALEHFDAPAVTADWKIARASSLSMLLEQLQPNEALRVLSQPQRLVAAARLA